MHFGPRVDFELDALPCLLFNFQPKSSLQTVAIHCYTFDMNPEPEAFVHILRRKQTGTSCRDARMAGLQGTEDAAAEKDAQCRAVNPVLLEMGYSHAPNHHTGSMPQAQCTRRLFTA